MNLKRDIIRSNQEVLLDIFQVLGSDEINTTDSHQGKDEKNSYISTIPKNILGFYLVERIEEYTLNSITGEKKNTDTINNESKLILTEKAIFFHRYK